MTEPAVESTPLFDQTTAALSPSSTPTAVDSTVDGGTATTTSTGLVADGPDLPPGPDLDALQAFTAAIPDEGHRAIAQNLVDAFTARDTQLQAFIALYTTAMGDVAALRSDVTTLQQQVAALQPLPAPVTS